MHRILRRVVIVAIVVGFAALFVAVQSQTAPTSIAAPETPIIPSPSITPTNTPPPTPTATPTPVPTSTPYVPESEQVRSTYYDGTDSAQVEYAHQPQFDAGIPMTIEAWVYRRDGSRCETILSHDYTASYWLGFCPDLRFYRNDNKSADATDTVPVGDWVHVAASYDGSTVRFYIDGESAGSEQLANDGTTIERPLILGGDWGGYHFDGFLDEVRLWSVARTQQEIRDGMFEDIQTHQDLQAVFPHGGRHEALSGVDGTVGSGTQESVFGMLPRDLQVPKAAISPNLDGEIGRGSEYAGAEQLVIRNRHDGTVDDTRAHLVRTDTDLYVGIEYPFDTTDGRSHEETWLGLMLDPDYSRESVADSDEVQAKMVLDADDENANWLVGDGSGGFEDCESALGSSNCPTLGDEWDVAKHYDDDVIVGPPLSVEYRISRELLGEWTEVDGLALAQFAIDDPDDVAPAPCDAVPNSPLTWARVTYTEGSASLPTAHIAGTVYNSLPGSQPDLKAGHDVYLIDEGGGGGILYSTQTNSEGFYSFDVPVPEGNALQLQSSTCASCIYAEANVWSDGIQPTAVYERKVEFPGCTQSDCDYATVEFYARDPIGPIALDSASPTPPTATLNLRTNPVTTTPPSQVKIHGENLHSLTNVYLSPYTFNDDPSTWVLYPATVVDRAGDESWVEIEVPGIPKRTKVNTENDLTYPSISREWRWVVEDTWDRVGAERWNTVGRFTMTPPAYPHRNGFGFDNHGDTPTLSEFLAVYGENAYICIGAFGVCATHVPDPLYWIAWEPIYTGLVSESGGSCVGLSATSLLMYQGDLQPEQYDADVSYAAGFIEGYGYDSNAQWDYGTGGPPLGPPEPANLWAEIRENHGVQFSSEFIHELLSDTAGDAALKGDPMTQYDEIQAGVFDNVISMVPSIGKGHAVTPYGIDGNRVHVYDNNYPLNANRYIDFDPGSNDYIFPRNGDEWRGDGIHTYPLDIWRNERTAPIDLEGLYNVVLGAADGHYTTDDGDEWGWRADGTFVNTMPGAASIPPLGPSPTDTHNVPLILPMTDTAPTVDVNTRQDGEYTYHAAQNKTVLQLEVFDAAANNTDQVALDYEQQTLNAFSFTPEETTEDLVPKVGMTPGERQRLMFRWGGLEVAGNGSVAFEELTDQHGAVFTNDAGSETSHRLVVDSVDGESETDNTYVFGPFTIPSGAVHRTTIADWPDSTQLRSEVDVDGDGTFDETEIVTGRECASDDANDNGLPDACEAGAGGTYEIYIPVIIK